MQRVDRVLRASEALQRRRTSSTSSGTVPTLFINPRQVIRGKGNLEQLNPTPQTLSLNPSTLIPKLRTCGRAVCHRHHDTDPPPSHLLALTFIAMENNLHVSGDVSFYNHSFHGLKLCIQRYSSDFPATFCGAYK